MSVHSIPLTFIFIKKLKHMEKCESVQNCIYNDNYTMCYRLNQFCSVTQSCPTLCNPMNCSTPGLPVHHQLLESTQTHVHPVDDAIQPSHSVVPFSPCPQSLPATGSFPMSQLFSSGAKVLEFQLQHQSFSEHLGLISFRMDWLDLLAVQGSPKSSPTPQFKSINSSALSFLHSPTLTSIYDHWKNHSLD